MGSNSSAADRMKMAEYRPTCGSDDCDDTTNSSTSLGISLLGPHNRVEASLTSQFCDESDSEVSTKSMRDKSLPATHVVFRSAGLCLTSDTTKWPTIVLGACMWALIVTIALCLVVSDHFDIHKFQCFNTLATIVWCTHSSLMFSIVARDSILCGGELEALIWDCASEDFMLPGSTLGVDTLTNPNHGYRNLKRLTARIAAAVVVFGTVNWVVSFLTFTDEFSSRMLPTGRNQAMNAAVVAIWFFYCIGWFLPMYFVKVPCSLMMCRVNRYINYLTMATSCSEFNLMEAMHLYDELFKLNNRLQKTIGFMATSSIGLLCVHGILLLLATLRHELSRIQRFSLIFWFFLNTMILLVTAHSIADLDFGNKRIGMAFAQASSAIQFCSDKQTIRFQLALLKINKTPFGVPFWGLQTPVSFSMIFKLGGIVMSLYLFLLGYGN